MERSEIQALVGLLAFASWVAVLMLGFSEADTTFSSYPTAVPGSESCPSEIQKSMIIHAYSDSAVRQKRDPLGVTLIFAWTQVLK